MATIGSVNIDLDANIAGLVRSLSQAERHLASVQRQATQATNSLLNMAVGAVGIYAVTSALNGLVSSGMNANRELENSEGKLWAMVAASRAYVDVTDEAVSTTDRMGAINRETTETMELLTKANAETSMGMTELIDVYALMKPGMDRNKVAIEDQINILKMVTNTASNFGVGADELANGIDDLADGTWKSASGFGKMMKSLQITQDEVKTTDNLLALLNARMADTGAVSDSMDVALSNLDVQWKNITGTLNKDIFGATKTAVKTLTEMMGVDGVNASKAYAESFREFANFAVQAVGFVLKAVNQLITTMQIAKKGYQLLGNEAAIAGNSVGKAWNSAVVAVGEFIGSDVSVDKKDIEDYNSAINERKRITDDLIAQGSKTVEANNKINDSISKLSSSFTTYKATVKDTSGVELASKATTKAVEDTAKKTKKAIKDTAKIREKALKDAIKLQEEFNEATALSTPEMGADIVNPYNDIIDSQAVYIENIKKAGSDQAKIEKANAKYTQDRLRGYSKLVGGIKGMFKENSVGQKAMSAMQKTSQAFELAWYIKKQVLEAGSIATQLANIVMGTTAVVAGETTKGVALGTNAVLAQAQGDPYTAWARMAAMAATVVGLGIAISGVSGGSGSGSGSAPDLGSTDKGSDSLSNALAGMNDVLNDTLKYTKQMTKSLNNIDKSFGGLGNTLDSMDLSASSFKGSQSSGFLGFSSSSTELQGTSLTIAPASVDDMINGQIQATSDVVTKVTKSSWWGLSTDVSYKTNSTDVTSAVDTYLASATSNLVDIFKVAGDILGMNNDTMFGFGKSFDEKLLNMTIDLGKIDTSGLDGSQIGEVIEGKFSAESDRIAQAMFPMVEQFQKANEAYTEALIRTVTTYEQVAYQLGNMGAEVTFYTANLLTDALGGLSEAQSKIGEYTDLYFSEQEKALIATKVVSDNFTSLGIIMPTTTEGFRDLVEGLDTTTKEGALAYASLIELAPAFYDVIDMNASILEAQMEGLREAEKQRLAEVAQAKEDAEAWTKWHNNLLKDAQARRQVEYLAQIEEERKLTEKLASELTQRRADHEDSLKSQADDITTKFNLERDLIKSKHDAEVEAKAIELEMIEDSIARYNTLREQSKATIETIKAERLGNLSYLTNIEKSQIADVGSRTSVELALETSASKADYIPTFERYMQELEKEVIDASNADLLDELRTITSRLEDIESVTKDSLYS